MNQRWRARWITSGGLEYEYRFTSLNSLVIARIDLWLKLIDLGHAIPNEVILEEDGTLPEGAMTWDYPSIRGM